VIAHLAATAAHRLMSLRDEFLAEYRQLHEPPAAVEAVPEHRELSCTNASTERSGSPDLEVPATAYGFSPRNRQDPGGCDA
jgi:hypothetical protein